MGTHWMRNLILHPTSVPPRNLSKPYKLKIRVEKVVLLFYYFLIFLPFYLKISESYPMVEIIILNPIGSYKGFFWYIFLRRPILDLKIPLIPKITASLDSMLMIFLS